MSSQAAPVRESRYGCPLIRRLKETIVRFSPHARRVQEAHFDGDNEDADDGEGDPDGEAEFDGDGDRDGMT